MSLLKDIKNAKRIAGYWHIEVFILVPWLIWFSLKVNEITDYLKIIAEHV